MFGGVCFMLNGNMLCGAGKNGYMFRVDRARVAEARRLPGGRPVVMRGRAMQGFSGSSPPRATLEGSRAGSPSPRNTSAVSRRNPRSAAGPWPSDAPRVVPQISGTAFFVARNDPRRAWQWLIARRHRRRVYAGLLDLGVAVPA